MNNRLLVAIQSVNFNSGKYQDNAWGIEYCGSIVRHHHDSRSNIIYINNIKREIYNHVKY